MKYCIYEIYENGAHLPNPQVPAFLATPNGGVKYVTFGFHFVFSFLVKPFLLNKSPTFEFGSHGVIAIYWEYSAT